MDICVAAVAMQWNLFDMSAFYCGELYFLIILHNIYI